MLLKTQGIVLQLTKYAEKSLIVKLFTLEAGLISVYIKNAQSKSKKGHSLQLLSRVETVVMAKPGSDLCNLRELKRLDHFSSLHTDVLKGSVIFFMAELLNRCIREKHQPNENLYGFLLNSLAELENVEHLAEIPIRFMINLTVYLGFVPGTEKGYRWFNLSDGIISDERSGLESISLPENRLLAHYLQHGEFPGKTTAAERNNLLHLMLEYYKYQIGEILDLKSPQILKEVLND